MSELWQLYDQKGKALSGQGGTKAQIWAGALHGGIHVWIWRMHNRKLEVLLQHRAPEKLTWPNCWDASVGGHIDLDEQPETTALRETKEELGIDLAPDRLALIAKRRDYLVAQNGAVENEFRWVYAYHMEANTDFKLEAKEVDAAEWRLISRIKADLASKELHQEYVPQGTAYFEEVFGAIQKLAGQQF